MIRWGHRREPWDQWRLRLIAETEAMLEQGLRNPHRVVSIPIVVAGQAEFPRAFAEAFWRRVLFESEGLW